MQGGPLDFERPATVTFRRTARGERIMKDTMNKLTLNKLANHITVVDEELDEVVELLGLFEGYDDSHAAPPEILRVTRAAVERIRAAQHVLAMMRDETGSLRGS
jgi:hypothetical protein